MNKTFNMSTYVAVWVTVINLNQSRTGADRLYSSRRAFKMCLCLFYRWQLHWGPRQICAPMCHMSWQACKHILPAMTSILTHTNSHVTPSWSDIQVMCGWFICAISKPFYSFFFLKNKMNKLLHVLMSVKNIPSVPNVWHPSTHLNVRHHFRWAVRLKVTWQNWHVKHTYTLFSIWLFSVSCWILTHVTELNQPSETSERRTSLFGHLQQNSQKPSLFVFPLFQQLQLCLIKSYSLELCEHIYTLSLTALLVLAVLLQQPWCQNWVLDVVTFQRNTDSQMSHVP